MSLLTRLISPKANEPSIPVHQFIGALAEYKRGSLTPAEVIEMFTLSESEQTDITALIANMNNDSINREKLHDVLMLGESGYYDINKVKTELGI